ncbi:Glutamate receptor-like 51 [Homarus americanus]|uniref:Glutamate receptor-like 51 n=1 Tax=Homarus americanus TaxID=6706 RepID=A0A8J5TK80_HOMAM|nr:Glutamate receptor-like 51 [Homarus americanus]
MFLNRTLTGLPNEPKSVSVRVVVGLWLLVSFILGSVYRSNLKAMLILPKIVLPFDNLAELRDSQIPLFVTESTHIHRAIVEANVNSSLAQVRGQTYWHVDQNKAIADLYAGRHAAAAIGASAKSITHSYFSKTGHCNVYVMSGDVLPGISQSLAFPKGSTLKPKVDNVIRRLKESGILDYLFLQSVFNSTECLKPFNTAAVTSSDLRSLDLGDFYGVLSLYAAGIVVAGLTFVLEKLLGRGRQ